MRKDRYHKAYTILVQEHTPMLLAYIRALGPSATAVDDIFQETMVTAWRRIDTFDTSKPFSAWIRGIARNHALEYFRRTKKFPVSCSDLVSIHIDQRIEAIESRTGDTWDDKLSALVECVEGLPQDHREMLSLFYQESLSTEEIAARLNSTREAVKKRLQRARAWIADRLREKGFFPLDYEVPAL